MKMTMVVARYDENIDWLKEVPWNYIVYNKGDDLPKWVTNEIKLKNIGLDAYTYLTYIIDNYDTLSDYVIFAQGDPFEDSRDFIKKINDFDGKDDFFPLSDSVYTDDYQNREMGVELAESVRKLFLVDIRSFEVPEGATFIVSKKAILFHTKKTYQKLMNYMIEADKEIIDDKVIGYKVYSAKFPHGGKRIFHKKTTLQEIIDSMTNEECLIGEHNRMFSPWVMEVLWKTLFDKKHKTIYD